MGSAAARAFGMCMLYVGVYKSSPGQAAFPMHPTHSPIATVHSSDLYTV